MRQIHSIEHYGTRWFVDESVNPRDALSVDPQPVRSLWYQRPNDYPHPAECWIEETGRPIPAKVKAFAIFYKAPLP